MNNCTFSIYFYHGHFPERQSHGQGVLLFHLGSSNFWEVVSELTRTDMSAKFCNWSRVVDFLTTFSQLSQNFLTTFSKISPNFLTTFSPIFHNFQNLFKTFSKLSQNFHNTFSQHSYNFLNTFSQLSHNFLKTFLILGNFLDALQLPWETYNFLNRPWFVPFRPLFLFEVLNFHRLARIDKPFTTFSKLAQISLCLCSCLKV